MTKEELDKWFEEHEEEGGKCIQSQGIIPPWLKYPGTPGPRSIAWRMGAGEAYMDDWCDWISTMRLEQRMKYLQNYTPIPEEWREWVVETIKSLKPLRLMADYPA